MACFLQLLIMESYNYKINSRSFSAFSRLENELVTDPHKNYLFDLSYLSILQVKGEHAQTFLQGQVSCDTSEVNEHQYQHGALCNLKGRILALIDILYRQHNDYLLIIPNDIMPQTQKSLEKTALLSRVAVCHDLDYQLFGLYIQNSNDILPTGGQPPIEKFGLVKEPSYFCYSLGNNLYILMIKNNHVDELCRDFKSHHQWRGSLAWHALTLQQKIIEIYPETRGLFLPHRLDLHRTGYLNFNKGCYKGQEIIARTHYRATLKHELRCFITHTNEPLRAGQRLLNATSNAEIGELIDYCPWMDNHYLIAASVLFDSPLTVRMEDHMSPVILIPYSNQATAE